VLPPGPRPRAARPGGATARSRAKGADAPRAAASLAVPGPPGPPTALDHWPFPAHLGRERRSASWGPQGHGFGIGHHGRIRASCGSGLAIAAPERTQPGITVTAAGIRTTRNANRARPKSGGGPQQAADEVPDRTYQASWRASRPTRSPSNDVDGPTTSLERTRWDNHAVAEMPAGPALSGRHQIAAPGRRIQWPEGRRHGRTSARSSPLSWWPPSRMAQPPAVIG
jgi:hypothetical protein